MIISRFDMTLVQITVISLTLTSRQPHHAQWESFQTYFQLKGNNIDTYDVFAFLQKTEPIENAYSKFPWIGTSKIVKTNVLTILDDFINEHTHTHTHTRTHAHFSAATEM